MAFRSHRNKWRGLKQNWVATSPREVVENRDDGIIPKWLPQVIAFFSFQCFLDWWCFTNPCKKRYSSNWILSPRMGVEKKKIYIYIYLRNHHLRFSFPKHPTKTSTSYQIRNLSWTPLPEDQLEGRVASRSKPRGWDQIPTDPYQVSCNRANGYSGFFGVPNPWVRPLEISCF